MDSSLNVFVFNGLNCVQVGLGEVTTLATARDQVQATTSSTCQDHNLGTQQPHLHQHHHQQHPHQHSQLTTTFHISRPSPPISTIISPPPPPPLHHSSSIILNHQDPYHSVSRMMIQNESDFHQVFFIYILSFLLLIMTQI